MIPKICDLCQQAGTEKLISLYWAWVNADRHRRAWLQKVCPSCFREAYARAILNAMEPVLMCPLCGQTTADDHDDVFVTYCVPGVPKDTSEMPCCGSCAVLLRGTALRNARELEDRGVATGGPQSPAIEAATVWASLGLRPRNES